MRALTLTQPWAGLVASGIKLVENRPRSMIKRQDFGIPFAIHASRVIDEALYERIAGIAPELPGRSPAEWGCRWHLLSRVTSAVIAVATIDSMLDPVAHGIGTAEPGASAPLADDQRRWFSGPIAYVLRDVRKLATPVPCRGWQGFWRLDADIERAVAEQLGSGSD